MRATKKLLRQQRIVVLELFLDEEIIARRSFS